MIWANCALAFDLWVRNGDRSLGETGGNPNLFWDVESDGLIVIDHNQAFDRDFSLEIFSETHAFRAQLSVICEDWILRQEYCNRFEKAMEDWQSICDTVPSDWWFVDAEHTVSTDFDVDETRRMLHDCQFAGFWSLR